MSTKRNLKLCVCRTNGQGLWSRTNKRVIVKDIHLYLSKDDYNNVHYGEMQVFFSLKSWNTTKDGLIYTDKKWISDFREFLRTLGYSETAIHNVDYSEQGMQGPNFVSLDVGFDFCREHLNPVLRFTLGQTVNNSIIKTTFE